jgi:uncharacterized membrane protein YqjE
MFGNSLTKFLKLDNLIANLTGYVETKVELVKVELKEDLASGIGTAINYLILAFVFALVILFVSTGTALVLAEKVGNFYGFGIVAAFYLVIGLILLANRKTLTKKITRQISENFKKKKQ